MPYQKLNGAASTVASYSTGLLTVAAGTGGRFGSPSAEDPLLLQTGAAGVIRATGYLVCIGRTGDVLAVSLTSGAVATDDIVAAGEAAEWWAEIIATYATIAALDDKQDALQTGATSSQYLGGDFMFHDLPSPGAGTVTSVGIALPTSLFVNGSAVTSTGNLTASLKTQAANTVWAGPASGADAAPAFRALVAADISPLLTDYATTSALSSHTGNTSNPHSVTKSQVGLGSVDNTSDLGKPISTLTQAALDGKQATLPSQSGNGGKTLGTDGSSLSWVARKDLICLGQWTSSGSSPLTAGDMAPQASLFPADFEVLYVSVIAKTNGGSGGFTFNLSINGVDLFAAAQSYAASTTTLAVISSGFAVSSITGGAEILAAIATAGSGVLSVTIALHGRPA